MLPDFVNSKVEGLLYDLCLSGCHLTSPASSQISMNDYILQHATCSQLTESPVDTTSAPCCSLQVVVICGRNKKLYDSLSQAQWPNGAKVIALGFVDNMHEWMNACDTIITKAGPGTIAEALICGLPILLNGNVPCQVGE